MEKILLIIIDFKRDHIGHSKKSMVWTVDEIVDEMQELVAACGGEVVEQVICRVDKPSAGYLINEGKVKDLVALCSVNPVDSVIFSHELKGSQKRNLEDSLNVKTIDRTQLILDIFARHATSKEGKLQVELAQLQYLLPRLSGKGTELSRLGGGIGTLGPGETKLEVDRRRISSRITKLKRGLKDITSDRALKRKKRKDKGVPAISLVGYTNAGKSTLLNTLTQADQKTRDGLFTTLDSLSRQLILPNHQKVVLSDTIGFMHELPHNLIESFKATLEEVKEADILLHVLDVSQPNFQHLHQSVLNVLTELGVEQKPILTVFNKIDKLEDVNVIVNLGRDFGETVSISAKSEENLSELFDKIIDLLSAFVVEVNVNIPIQRMDLVHLAHQEGEVYSVKYYSKTINLRAALPTRVAGQFYKEAVEKGHDKSGPYEDRP